MTGIGGHHSPKAASVDWLTPPYILEALGAFDLDPCAAPEPRPWPTAAEHWGRADDPLTRRWYGRVWLNPPYGQKAQVGPWMHRLADHGRGTALIFARTETSLFFETVWSRASGVLFLRGRLTFYLPDGTRHPTGSNSGGPSVLIAYGADDADRLRRSGLPGFYTDIQPERTTMTVERS